MSYMKRFAEDVSKDMGCGGELTDDVMAEANRRLQNPDDPCTKRAAERIAKDRAIADAFKDKQPLWNLVANLGDASSLDHGGYFIYEDETGVYPPEAEYLEVTDEDKPRYFAYRFPMHRCCMHNDTISDNDAHPFHTAWFDDSLNSVAESADISRDDLIELLCSPEPKDRACGYRHIAEYHGWENFDEIPLQLTKKEARKRYGLDS